MFRRTKSTLRSAHNHSEVRRVFQNLLTFDDPTLHDLGLDRDVLRRAMVVGAQRF